MEEGFTHVTNNDAPLFVSCPNHKEGYQKIIGDGEEMRRIFKLLADPAVMHAVIWVHSQPRHTLFEGDVLIQACRITKEDLPHVLQALESLYLIGRKDLEIDGIKQTLFSTTPSHKIIALLLLTHEINHPCLFSVAIKGRKSSYL